MNRLSRKNRCRKGPPLYRCWRHEGHPGPCPMHYFTSLSYWIGYY